jgi:transposase-like protein
MTHRRRFSREYKLEAVRAAERTGNVAQTARDLDLKPELIYRWRRELDDGGRRAFSGNGVPRDEEMTRLKRENKRLQQENEILKKAVGIVSSPPR